MTTISQEPEVEREASEAASYYRRAAKNRESFWKGVAGVLITILLAVGVHAYDQKSGITRAEAAEMITGPINPYVQDKPVIEQHLENIDKKLLEVQSSQSEQQRRLYSICIALGVDPDGTAVEVHKRKAGNQ